jgi:glyoxylate/hydroxypyruvate reductase
VTAAALALVIGDWDVEPWARSLMELAPDRQILTAPDIRKPEDVAYALCWKPRPGLLATMPNLQVIYSLGAGVDHIYEDNALPNVPVVRIIDPDLSMRMSEYVVLHVLMHHRKQRAYDDLQAKSDWREFSQAPASAVRVGIMGLGVLGMDAAQKLKILGFQINGWSRTAKNLDGVNCFSGEDGLDKFLRQTDILVCLLPHTPATDGILDRALFEKLSHDGPLGKPVLINAGRGGLQREVDIISALDDGTLGAATLDVFETEPLPAASPLWQHKGLTITPHNASASDPETILRNVLKQIAVFEAGETMDNIVDPAQGY